LELASEKEIAKGSSALDLAQKSYSLLELIWKKINIGEPMATTVTYLYPKSQMETTRIYRLPSHRRQLPLINVDLPVGNNFQILNIFDLDTGNDYANISVHREENKVIIDPKNLPSSSERFMIRTVNDVDRALLRALVDVRVSEVASREEEDKEKHWITAAIKDESLLREFYNHVTLEDVDIGVGINVDRHYSTVLKTTDTPLIRLMRANQDIFKGIDMNQRSLEMVGRDRRRRILKEMKRTKEDIFTSLARLCLPEIFRSYISMDNPNFTYIDARRSESLMTLGNIMIPIPSGMNVTVYTTLRLGESAQKGNLIFDRNNFCSDVEKVIRKHFKL
jgi:hypothetical protein